VYITTREAEEALAAQDLAAAEKLAGTGEETQVATAGPSLGVALGKRSKVLEEEDKDKEDEEEEAEGLRGPRWYSRKRPRGLFNFDEGQSPVFEGM
jgi:hypothetical protein